MLTKTFHMTLSKFMILISVISITATSCNNSDENSSLIFDELSESLERSNLSIQSSTNNVLQELKQKTEEPSTKEKAELWLQKATVIVDESNSLKSLLDSLEKEINGAVSANSYPAKAEAAAKEILVDQKCGARIFDRLKAYKVSVLKVDDGIKKEFCEKPFYSDSLFLSGSKTADEFSFRLFKNSSLSQALCLLQKIKNSILLTENELLNYSLNNSYGIIDNYSKFELITIADRRHYKNGDEMVIYSGVGSFSMISIPKFFIDGKKTPVDENGVAVYKTVVNGKPGKHIISVKVDYTGNNGARQTVEKHLEYEVDE